MSYRGLEQVICKNGHYFEREDSGYYYDPAKCSCGAEDGWNNWVNDVTGKMLGVVEPAPFLISEPVVEVCNLGHSHVVKQAVYRVPTKEETDPLRTTYPNTSSNSV